MRSATVVGAAPVPGEQRFYKSLIERAELLVAADAGASLCRSAGRVPDILIGDLDSISADVLEWAEREGATLLRAPSRKDVTDLDLALAAAQAQGSTEAIVTASWSARLDHTVAALGAVASCTELIVDLTDPGLNGWILRPGLRDRIVLGPAGSECSLFALTGPAIVTTAGMRYELSSGTLTPLSSLGLSNVVERRSAAVSVESGVLLVLSTPDVNETPAFRIDGG